jgi:hypothetical protein
MLLGSKRPALVATAEQAYAISLLSTNNKSPGALTISLLIQAACPRGDRRRKPSGALTISLLDHANLAGIKRPSQRKRTNIKPPERSQEAYSTKQHYAGSKRPALVATSHNPRGTTNKPPQPCDYTAGIKASEDS